MTKHEAAAVLAALRAHATLDLAGLDDKLKRRNLSVADRANTEARRASLEENVAAFDLAIAELGGVQ